MKIEPTLKNKAAKKSLTFGDVVAGVYQTCGKRKARGIVHLAIALHLIEFRGKERFVIA